ncbi:hypothetical protein Ptr902_09590 [Pyrenophora tritici-repentis]|nr:hypothetical protein Ptr902_09590 [Pyrenophora tritici-repentis]
MNSEPIGEAPPVYTPGPVGKAAFNQPSSASTTSDNDLYAFLKTFDTVFLIDDSGSMAGRSWGERRKKHSKPSPQSAPRTTKTALTYTSSTTPTLASTSPSHKPAPSLRSFRLCVPEAPLQPANA